MNDLGRNDKEKQFSHVQHEIVLKIQDLWTHEPLRFPKWWRPAARAATCQGNHAFRAVWPITPINSRHDWFMWVNAIQTTNNIPVALLVAF